MHSDILIKENTLDMRFVLLGEVLHKLAVVEVDEKCVHPRETGRFNFTVQWLSIDNE